MTDEIKPPSITNPDSPTNQLARLHDAIAEVSDKQSLFTSDTYTQVLLALYERRRALLTSSRNVFEPGMEDYPDDEIRWVTVMFMDVVDSTQIAEQIDIENWRTVLGEAHRRLGDTVKRWGGEIGQYLGDGLMCYFGARRSQGNDAARAVSCALAMQNTISEYHAELQEQHGIETFMARVGISTGRVVVGTIGSDQKVDLLAMGATTNLAARLQSICPPAQVVVDRETYRHTRAEFEFKTLEPTFLKGFAAPIDHYLVTREQDEDGGYLSSNRIGEIMIPFVGRGRLMTNIAQQMQDVARHDDFLMMTIFGDTGIGKSRLLREVALSETAEAFFTVRMSGHYEQRDVRFSLLRDMLSALFELSPSMSVREIEDTILDYTLQYWDVPDAEMAAAIVGYAAGYGFNDTPYIQSLQHALPHQEDKQIRTWVRRWLRGVAGQHPILLLVDSLQWADADSLQLLNHLQNDDLGGIVVLAAARPEFRTEANLYLNKIQRQDLTLLPLSSTFTRRMIDAVLQYVDGTHERLMDLIVERAEGNPLFVEEFLRMLFDNGVFKQVNDRHWQLDELQFGIMRDALPTGLLGVFQARLDDLPPTERRVVQIAAVIGQSFWSVGVNNVIGTDVSDRFRALVDRRIIVEKPESRFDGTKEYMFRNSLYHDVAYQMLPRAYRRSYHQQVARWLSGIARVNPDAFSLLADHYTKAEEPLQALSAYKTAAAYQFEQGYFKEVGQSIDNGLQIGGNVPREDALPFTSALWLLKGRVAYWKRDYAQATADSKTALMLMHELPANELLNERVQATVTLGNALTSIGSFGEALDALTQSYQLTDNTDLSMQRAAVLRAFGQLFWAQGNLKEATAYQQRALDSAEQNGNLREIAATQSMLVRIHIDQGELHEALTKIDQVRRINIQMGSLTYQISDLRLLASIYLHLFNYELAAEALDTAVELGRRINYVDPLVVSTRGALSVETNEPNHGLKLLQQAVANEHYNIYEYHNVLLAQVRALALTGQDVRCLEAAAALTARVQDSNPIVYGRCLLWTGLAKAQLGQDNVIKTLRWSLDNEQTFGGRDQWMCHYALALTEPDASRADYHYDQAKASFYKRTEQIEDHADVRKTLASFEQAIAIFRRWQPQAQAKRDA